MKNAIIPSQIKLERKKIDTKCTANGEHKSDAMDKIKLIIQRI